MADVESSEAFMRMAEVCRDAALSEIEESIVATGRFSTFEIQELGVSHTIRNWLAAFSRETFSPPLRICQEYGVGVISNVGGIAEVAKRVYRRTDHPVDVAVLYPVQEVSSYDGPLGYAWAPQNCAAIGLIEVKIRSGPKSDTDVVFLSEAVKLPKRQGMRHLKWVMFVVIAFGTELQVKTTPVSLHFLDLLTSSGARQIPTGPGSERVTENWYDVRCYGRMT